MPRPRHQMKEGNTGWVVQQQWLQVERRDDWYVSVVVGQAKPGVWHAVGVVSPGRNIVEIFDNHSHKVIGETFKTEKSAKRAAEKWLKKYVKEIVGPNKGSKRKKKTLDDKCACEVVDAKKIRARLKKSAIIDGVLVDWDAAVANAKPKERTYDSHGACTGCGDRLCPGGC